MVAVACILFICMKILFIGDIFGKSGRNVVSKLLKNYIADYEIDLVIANGENLAHGKGVSKEAIIEMEDAGVNFFTSGNHIWCAKAIIPFLNEDNLPIVRPANYPINVPGKGFEVVETNSGKSVLVINLLGQVFFKDNLNCPFETVDRILEGTKAEKFSAIFVDFHAEATSEKWAMAHYLDGRVSAVLGTHTHVATADARILDGGTAFQSDAGFCGSLDSIIGAVKEPVIEHFISKMPMKIEPADSSPYVFNATIIDIDDSTGRALSINPIYNVFS